MMVRMSRSDFPDAHHRLVFSISAPAICSIRDVTGMASYQLHRFSPGFKKKSGKIPANKVFLLESVAQILAFAQIP